MRIKTNQGSNQQGFVSIIVTLIIMIILTLIVLGYAQLSRREQRAALDRQLSTQAFYAAESGVNDLVAAIKDNPSYFTGTKSSKASCDMTSLKTDLGLRPDLDTANGVKYTCLLYDMNPQELVYTGITPEKVQVIPISNNNLAKLSFNWNGKDLGSSTPQFRPPSSQGLPPPAIFEVNDSSWNSEAGVMRIMIIPRANLSRTNLTNGTFNGFLYPNNSGVIGPGTQSYAAGVGQTNSGVVIAGNCNSSNAVAGCNAEVTGLGNGSGGYYIVVHSVYTTNDLKIHGYDSFNNPVDLTGAQISIDATGQASDVLRRFEIRRPLSPGNENILPLGFESMQDICKQITIRPGQSPSVADNASCPAF